MRRAAVTLFTVIIMSASSVRAAPLLVTEREPRKNMLLLNPGDLFSGIISLEYERGLASWFGITLGLSIFTFHSVFNTDEPTFNSITPELGFRFHFIRHAPRGLWIGPYISPGYVFGRSSGSVSRAWSWGLGAALGYNFVLGEHFTFQLGAGGGFIDYGDHVRWDPRLKLGIGATF